MIQGGHLTSHPEIMLQKMNHTGEYKDSGYHDVNVELAYIFETDLNDMQIDDFLDFIANHISNDYFVEDEFYNSRLCRSWCKLESYEPEKWLKAYEDFNEQKLREQRKNAPPVQLKLF